MEAIKSLPTNFTQEEKATIMSKVNPRLYGKLRQIFLVLDDDIEKVNKSTDGGSRSTRGRSTKRANESPSASVTSRARI